MILRRAAADDVPALEDIVERAYSVYIERIGRRPGPMDADYPALVREADVFVGVDDAGVVCGLIVLAPAPDHVVIENVAVDPARQRAGVGRMLLAFAEEFAVDRGLPEIRLYTNVAMVENQRLYRRLGYQETGVEIGPKFRRVHFSKRLRPDVA